MYVKKKIYMIPSTMLLFLYLFIWQIKKWLPVERGTFVSNLDTFRKFDEKQHFQKFLALPFT